MSERLPYELQLQQQWIDLPLPDENMAWADMRRRLEEDEDRPVIAWWRRGCVMWIAIGLILIALIWWWLNSKPWFSSPLSSEQQQEQRINSSDSTNTTNTTAGHTGPNERSITTESTTALIQQQRGDTSSAGNDPADPASITDNSKLVQPGDRPLNNNPSSLPATGPGTTINAATPGRSNMRTRGGKTGTRGTTNGTGRTGERTGGTTQTRTTANPRGGTPPSASITTRGGNTNTRREPQPTKSPDSTTVPGQQQPSIPPVPDNVVPPADRTDNYDTTFNPVTKDPLVAEKDSVKKDTVKRPVAATPPKTDSIKKKGMWYSAGLGMHQQIPLAGQTLTPYSASGRKFSLGDYIPSVYFRANKDDKWFVQGEFRYGAPQYTKDILYKNQTKRDSVGVGQQSYIVTTRQTLKKTFYHQLPVTFNYYILPDWSLGAGMAWNKFSSAVIDLERTGVNTRTGVDTIYGANGIMQVKKDSAFSNSYFQGVLETHYKWRRFSFGVRYMFGLQPYLKFELPGGTRQEERNSSLQVFIRYELWRSRRK